MTGSPGAAATRAQKPGQGLGGQKAPKYLLLFFVPSSTLAGEAQLLGAEERGPGRGGWGAGTCASNDGIGD